MTTLTHTPHVQHPAAQRTRRVIAALALVLAAPLVGAEGAHHLMLDPGKLTWAAVPNATSYTVEVSESPSFSPLFASGSELDRLYGLYPHVQRVSEVNDPRCATYLCYCPQANTLDLAALGYTPIPLLASIELRCGRTQ